MLPCVPQYAPSLVTLPTPARFRARAPRRPQAELAILVRRAALRRRGALPGVARRAHTAEAAVPSGDRYLPLMLLQALARASAPIFPSSPLAGNRRGDARAHLEATRLNPLLRTSTPALARLLSRMARFHANKTAAPCWRAILAVELSAPGHPLLLMVALLLATSAGPGARAPLAPLGPAADLVDPEAHACVASPSLHGRARRASLSTRGRLHGDVPVPRYLASAAAFAAC